MKKSLLLVSAAFLALLTGCVKEQPFDNTVNPADKNVEVYGGIHFIVSGQASTKVSVDIVGDPGSRSSHTSWEADDHLAVWYDGHVYDFVTKAGGDEAEFGPASQDDVLTALDGPVGLYYNCAVAADGTVQFTVPSEQVYGEVSNKPPFYAYVVSPVLSSGGCVSAVLKPLAHVLEFEVKLSKQALNIGKLMFGPGVANNSFDGALAYAGACTLDPETGVVTPGAAEQTVSVSYPDGLAIPSEGGVSIQVVVGSFATGNSSCGAGEASMALRLYDKESGAENCCRTLWAAAGKSVSFNAGNYKHYVQPIADLTGYKVDITADNFSAALAMLGDTTIDDIEATMYTDATGAFNLDGVTVSGRALPSNTFDGRGKVIKNYQTTSGLFANLASGQTIKNLNFDSSCSLEPTSFAANSGSYYNIGILVNESNGGTISAVSSSAAVTVNGALVESSRIGGIVGNNEATSGKVEKCGYDGILTVTFEKNSNSFWVGGVTGRSKSPVNDCTNDGKVCVTVTDLSGSGYLYIGGVVGSSSSTSHKNLVNKKNGSVTIDGVVGSAKFVTHLGGCIGYTTSTLAGCKNYGAIKTDLKGASSVSKIYHSEVGGIAGCSNKTVSGCENHGTVTLKADGNITFTSGGQVEGGISVTCVGGIVAGASNAIVACENSTNYGAVELYAPKATSGIVSVGGIAGAFQGAINGCRNASTGTVHVYGGDQSLVGGIAGQAFADGSISGSDNYGAVDVSNFSGTNYHKLFVGGILGSLPNVDAGNKVKVSVSNSNNHGSVASHVAQNVYLGGICGGLQGSVSNSSNTGTVTGVNVRASTANGVGGIIGYSRCASIEGGRCSGPVSVPSISANGSNAVYVGGAVGRVYGTEQAEILNFIISSNVASSSTVTGVAVGSVEGNLKLGSEDKPLDAGRAKLNGTALTEDEAQSTSKLCGKIVSGKTVTVAAAHNIRVLFWNIKDGMIDDKDNDYTNFTAYISRIDPDVCIFAESKTVAQDNEGHVTTYAKDWSTLAFAYGHSYTKLGPEVSDYPQVITSRYALSDVVRISTGLTHGSQTVSLTVGGKTLNVVSLHLYPTTDKGEGVENAKRLGEIEAIINGNSSISTGNWIFAGDYNSRSWRDYSKAKAAGKNLAAAYYPSDEDNSAYSVIKYVENAGLTDALDYFSPATFVSTQYWDSRLDYIFVNDAVKDMMIGCRVDSTDDFVKNIGKGSPASRVPSDHKPVILDIRL